MKQADRIIIELLDWLPGNNDILLPNFYYKIFEMDIFRLLSSGYICEYEVKVSRSDFFADFNKKFRKELKHDRLKKGNGPNRFFFVVPENLINTEEVPKHCGLIFFTKRSTFHIVKNAPLLHRLKYDEKRYRDLAISLSYRDRLNKNRIRDLRKENEYLKILNQRHMKNQVIKEVHKCLKPIFLRSEGIDYGPRTIANKAAEVIEINHYKGCSIQIIIKDKK